MKWLEVFLLPLDRMPVHHRSLPSNLSGFPNNMSVPILTFSLKFNVSETSTNHVYVNQFYCNQSYIQEKLQVFNYMLEIDSWITHVCIADLFFVWESFNASRHSSVETFPSHIYLSIFSRGECFQRKRKLCRLSF